MKKARFFAVLALLFVSFAGAFAQQNLRSGYFLDGYAYRNKLNPAFANERGYFTIGIGNINVGAESNFSLNSFIRPIDGGYGSIMSSAVLWEDIEKSLSNINRASASVNATILSVGFWTGKKLYHTIDLNVRAEGNGTVPYSVVQAIKNPSAFDRFSADEISVKMRAYTELSYGLTGLVGDCVSIGARAKFLVGIGNADAVINNFEMVRNGGSWDVNAESKMNVNLPGIVKIPTKGEIDPSCSPERFDRLRFADLKFDINPSMDILKSLKIPGYGASFDFGVSWKFADYFTLSAAVLDLGFMMWNNHKTAVNPAGGWNFAGFSEIPTVAEGAARSLKDQYDDFSDMIDDCFPFVWENQDAPKQIEMLQTTVNAGFEAKMPFYERLSFGLLGTAHIDKGAKWYEGRFSANIAPLDWLSFATDYAYSSFGHSFGFVMNIHCQGFNFFVGTDSLLPVINLKNKVPTSRMNTNAAFGINFHFGKKHDVN